MITPVGGRSVLDGVAAVARVGVGRGPGAPGRVAAVASFQRSPQGDRVELSLEARKAAAFEGEGGRAERRGTEAAPDGEPRRYQDLSDDEQKQVRELRVRDREVRAHELAHKATAGSFAGRISFTYETGPDGRRYAAGGEVPIDLSPIEGDPQATIAKMQTVRRAALAPANPSAADRSVAARASQIERDAQAEARGEGRVAGGPGDERTLARPNAGRSRVDLLA